MDIGLDCHSQNAPPNKKEGSSIDCSGQLMFYTDLKAAIESVDKMLSGISSAVLESVPKIYSLFMVFYTTVSYVRVDSHNSISELDPVLSGVRQGCTVAPDLFLVPMDFLMVSATIGMEKEPFADDVALLAEMLSVLVLALEVTNTGS